MGKCEAPGFTTAGGHWNPTMHQHGKLNPMGPHQGDLPNLVGGADGRGTLTVTIAGATLEGLMDADGGAIVIHEKADDLKTDPSG
ncbi:superoxide dismutase family protein, partial [Acinetobacter baumannii]